MRRRKDKEKGDKFGHVEEPCPNCAIGNLYIGNSLVPAPMSVLSSWATSVFSVSSSWEKTETPSEPLPVEQSTEPVVAYRGWNLGHRYPDGPVLHSLNSGSGAGGERWEPMRRMEARCSVRATMVALYADGSDEAMKSVSKGHVSPEPSCTCGIYAHADHVDVQPGEPIVVGEVYLWGRVIVCERGYRAQYAYPKRLAVIGASQHVAGALEASYGVPCESWA